MTTQYKQDLNTDGLAECLIKSYLASIAALQHMVTADFGVTSVASSDLNRLDISGGNDRAGVSLELAVVFGPNTGSDKDLLRQGWPQRSSHIPLTGERNVQPRHSRQPQFGGTGPAGIGRDNLSLSHCDSII